MWFVLRPRGMLLFVAVLKNLAKALVCLISVVMIRWRKSLGQFVRKKRIVAPIDLAEVPTLHRLAWFFNFHRPRLFAMLIADACFANKNSF